MLLQDKLLNMKLSRCTTGFYYCNYQIASAIQETLSVRCPSSLLNPPGTAFLQDYEKNTPYSETGRRVTDITPFCGKTASLNPLHLFVSNSKVRPINLSFFSKVRRGKYPLYDRKESINSKIVRRHIVTL